MTRDQKNTIADLHSKGFGYKRIAAQMGLSPNTVKSYLRTHEPVEIRSATEEISTAVVIKEETSTPTSAERKISAPVAAQREATACLCCNTPVIQTVGRKQKKFCSDTCRNRWWRAHMEQVERHAIYAYTCPICGSAYTAYGNANRKYCSRACYMAARSGGKR